MYKYLMLSVLLLSVIASIAQTYQGTSDNSGYQCTLRINKDSTVNVIFATKDNNHYAEYRGNLSKWNDSIFHVSARMTVGQFGMKTYHADTFYIRLEPSIAHELDKIQIEYSNKTYKQLQGYDRMGNPMALLKVPIDKSVLNDTPGSDFVIITINKRNYVSGELLAFRIPYGSAASFTSGQQMDFNVMIRKGQLYTIDDPPVQTGHFTLYSK